MSVSLKPLNRQVIVITGGSSGIGLATARAAAARGAKVVIAARNAEVLAEVEREITQGGGQALHVVADVGSQADVEAVAARALERFGRIDTWVNDAGVSIFGRIEAVPEEDGRKLFDTNFWGVVHGSTVAVRHLKAEGGALINLGSVASDAALPLQGMYSASKHAIKGFTDALRMELEQEGVPVSVTLIKPGAVGTPLIEHLKNYSDKEPSFPPPIYDPADVAEAILHAAVHPRRDIHVGSAARAIGMLRWHAPRTSDRVGETVLFDAQLQDEPAAPRRDNLHRAGTGGQVRGRHPGRRIRPSLYTHASLHPVATGALAVAVGLAAAALLAPRDTAAKRRTAACLGRLAWWR